MSQTKRRIHAASTVSFSSAMLLSGTGNLLRLEAFAENLRSLGYPLYLLSVLGVAKLLGALALLYPRAPRVREWAYAGFAFELGGATVSQLIAGSSWRSALSPALCGALLAVSYLTKPAESARRLCSAAPKPARPAGALRAGS